MPDAQSPPELSAAWIVSGAMRAGIDLWLSGETVSFHGPQPAREAWTPVFRAYRPLLVAYLAHEVFPVNAGRR